MAAALACCAIMAAAPTSSAAPRAGIEILDREANRNLTPLVVTDQYVVWESAGGEESSVIPTLRQRDLRTNRIRILAQGVVPHFGLASTSRWVVYAVGRGSTLVAARHDGSGRATLSKQLVAPIAGRGEKVAWAEQDAKRQRVYVRDMATGTKWLAADLPRCASGRCYRIDAVGLAEDGVVFVRGAIGPQPSFIVRRGFSDPRPTSLPVPNDPQPDLAPSSAGALYYAFGRGWYRWDFGRSDSRLTRFRGARQIPVVRNEGNDWLVRVAAPCKGGLQQFRGDGSGAVVGTAKRVLALAGVGDDDCAELLDVAVSRARLISSWFVHGPTGDPDEEAFTGIIVSQPYRAS
jgi:hypothetical protein